MDECRSICYKVRIINTVRNITSETDLPEPMPLLEDPYVQEHLGSGNSSLFLIFRCMITILVAVYDLFQLLKERQLI